MRLLLAWILFIQAYIIFGDHNTGLDQCGIANSNRIIGGKNASMGAYPWIARIGYIKKNDKEKDVTFRCGGTVITEIYVITAAHCIVNLANNIIVSRIRLGEHNTETNPDCIKSFCNLPYQDFEAAQITPHESYDKPKLQNDLGLIKLNKVITFNEYIKPICMMKAKLLKKNFIGQAAEVAGWGVYDINEPQMSSVLQTVKLPIVEIERCVIGYKIAAPIGYNQLCVGGKVGQDSCGGDSGGPLMKVDVDGPLGPRYYIIGIVSFGAKLCGETNLPGVYTKIASYMPWVYEHIKA
ncbi:PREDICTED: proclotting enzyme-like [Ceratosolen solmsi marchali]|uniref:Proclotting enzyme-like n=1 Tax=Ceratosolen solmsi marchali TaxID=326594 RepID=A0AAJ7E0X3_9HYME|nr:PREDICTED: proclotting enzyme-like [Ceratosolen solmsi marchali]